jgi:hypothetical protein
VEWNSQKLQLSTVKTKQDKGYKSLLTDTSQKSYLNSGIRIVLSFRWAILIIRWLCSVTSLLPAIPASPLFTPSLTYYPLIAQLSRDPPRSYPPLGRKEKFSLCSLKGYPLGKGRLLASGNRFPNSVSTWDYFKFSFIQGSLLVGGVKTARDRKPLGVRMVAMRVGIFFYV